MKIKIKVKEKQKSGAIWASAEVKLEITWDQFKECKVLNEVCEE